MANVAETMKKDILIAEAMGKRWGIAVTVTTKTFKGVYTLPHHFL